MKVLTVTTLIIALLNGCSNAPQKKMMAIHPAHLGKPEHQVKVVYERDKASCQMKAYTEIQVPASAPYVPPRSASAPSYDIYGGIYGNKIGELRPQNYANSAPNLGSIMDGYNAAAAANAPRRAYENAINTYQVACLKSKGWTFDNMDNWTFSDKTKVWTKKGAK